MAPAAFPDFVNEQGSGTVVTFLGNTDGRQHLCLPERVQGLAVQVPEYTVLPLTDGRIEVFARVPSGDVEDWPQTRKKPIGVRTLQHDPVIGTAPCGTTPHEFKGEGFSRSVALAGDPAQGIPPAEMHWWVLPTP